MPADFCRRPFQSLPRRLVCSPAHRRWPPENGGPSARQRGLFLRRRWLGGQRKRWREEPRPTSNLLLLLLLSPRKMGPAELGRRPLPAAVSPDVPQVLLPPGKVGAGGLFVVVLVPKAGAVGSHMALPPAAKRYTYKRPSNFPCRSSNRRGVGNYLRQGRHSRV